jgi:hypothetical protein
MDLPRMLHERCISGVACLVQGVVFQIAARALWRRHESQELCLVLWLGHGQRERRWSVVHGVHACASALGTYATRIRSNPQPWQCILCRHGSICVAMEAYFIATVFL